MITAAHAWFSPPTIASNPSVAHPSHRANPNRDSPNHDSPSRANPTREDDRIRRSRTLARSRTGRARGCYIRSHTHSLGSTKPKPNWNSQPGPTSFQRTASRQESVCACQNSFCAIPARIRMPPRGAAETRAEPGGSGRILWTENRPAKDHVAKVWRSVRGRVALCRGLGGLRRFQQSFNAGE